MRRAPLVLLLALVACQSPKKEESVKDETVAVGTRRAAVIQFDALMARHKKQFGRAAQSFGVSTSPLTTINYVLITGKIPPHRHLDHDEIFIVVDGSGLFYVESPDGGIQSHEVTAGTIFHVPRGVAHAYVHMGKDPAETNGISIFSPAYTKPDREDVDWPAGTLPSKEGSNKGG